MNKWNINQKFLKYLQYTILFKYNLSYLLCKSKHLKTKGIL